jgi:hypothetical protein
MHTIYQLQIRSNNLYYWITLQDDVSYTSSVWTPKTQVHLWSLRLKELAC